MNQKNHLDIDGRKKTEYNDFIKSQKAINES